MSNDRRRTYHSDGSYTWTTRRDRLKSFARTIGQVLAVGVGIAFVVLAVANVADAFNQTEEFNHVKHCGDGLDCFERHEVLVVGRDIRTTTSRSDGDTPISHTTTDFMITWQRPDGSRSSEAVSLELYRNAQEGQAATLRMWRGHDVAITAGTETYWFTAPGAEEATFWLVIGAVGLALVVWNSARLWAWFVYG
ncbi:hypothetical protein ACIBEH_31800 [Nocardia salmonicida]|uniref:hypothetical protein n=1 Tax=Nocardia salmonicida TaxID=53431 RepID=UPI0037A53C3A